MRRTPRSLIALASLALVGCTSVAAAPGSAAPDRAPAKDAAVARSLSSGSSMP